MFVLQPMKCFPSGSVVKIPPAMQEMRVRFLGQEDPLEKEVATHSSVLVWEIPWTEEPGGHSPWNRKESDTTEGLSITQQHTVWLTTGATL